MSSFAKKPASFKVFETDLDDQWTQHFSTQSCLAIDTEAMGLIHGRDRLCLVQICDEQDNVACIKIQQHQTKANNLQSLMEDSAIEKVFHYARFDVAAISCNLNIAVNSIFCTKLASKIGRTYSPRHGLKEVILELVGIELDKQAQSSDWGRVGELTEKQLEYATNDVRYLIQARNQLEKMLIREDRWELTKRCFECISVMSELDIRRFHNIFEH
ncbi:MULTISPECIES: ribonuclease D [Prochlorococcus]|uniref:Ribonuclease D n=1 Tax=Prochlorococcus marinus (strain SARG / CCMP1375 / SS120) TaxID=167539 RepID=Q7V9T4_PROMA|nr:MULTISPECIES: ribonuclease D [Prochlorococcus]AAQ00784.1 Ribonuclease D [Prochlorococcus marinus subsp. marinus str. CCMP1375]KGG10722.1 Ribonuclease D related protein [Prochlorococcus marinus str. LG]KGG21144.1 Ribonuclease D related protein [Prochlorococcus marinus str. SS2]KGG23967.1 Ribonuclease D related protein [Prochlorococcus marinus str. SS35]KGG31772.1 Ribonuclease D related protein [Prochlorococcus marinus str. SS51]